MRRPKKYNQEGKGVIDILEEAVELLRQAPLSALAAYYFGTVPFGLGLLYFWADMSRSADAIEILAQDVFGLTLLFLWMKTWQTYFTRILWAHLSQGPAPQWTLGQTVRAVLTQMAFQAWGFLAIPVAAGFMIPFAWVYAFFQNVTVLGDGSEESLRELYRKAWRQAGVWPRQNNLTLLWISFFCFFLFVNLAVTLLLGPEVLKSFLGIETIFSRSVLSLLNTTFFAIVCVLTYLCADPLTKAVFTLRCFYGESLNNGEDLKAGLNAVILSLRTLLFLALLGWGSQTPAQAPPEPSTASPTVSSTALKTTIEETLTNSEYRWHMPRVRPDEPLKFKEPGIMTQFLEGSLRTMIRGLKAIGRWIGKVLDWIGKYFKPDFKPDRQVKSSHWDFEWLYGFLWLLLAVVLCALALLIYRIWMRREKLVVLSQAVLPMPDVADERVLGNELPMDGWMEMARDLLRQGNFRLALRAFYLASLACLARQKLLTIAKFKSTMDYERELNRRAHSLPQLLLVFSEGGRLFDRGWYGDYEVTQGMVESFVSCHQKIESLVEPRKS